MRVIELGSSVAGAYCCRVLGLLGWDVVKVEPRHGDPTRRRSPLVPGPSGQRWSALFEYLNCNKRSVCLEQDSPEGGEVVRRLASQSEILVDYSDGHATHALDMYEGLRAVNPSIVYTVISGFGLSGPYRDYRSNDFLDLASGGQLYLTGHPDRPPVQAGGPWAGYATGTLAASACLVAARRARSVGRGQLVDVGAMEALAILHQWTITLFTHQGYVKRRAGNRMAESYHPMDLVECQDGWVSLAVSGGPAWEGFCLAIGQPELLADPRFQTGGDRYDHAGELDAIIAPWFAATTVGEAVARLQAHRVPAGPVVPVPDVLNDPHLAARGYWSAAPHLGVQARLPTRGFHTPGDAALTYAPGPGQHTQSVLDELGFSAAEMRSLVDSGRVGPWSGHEA
jgi:crotonobetainyl-CoA:carnitine CoA-transferase CaiB-like acyl-CoA transferase